MNNINEHRIRFKHEFLEQYVKNLKPGDVISDLDLKLWCENRNINLTKIELIQVVRELELTIGKAFKLRLKRLRSTGYTVLESLEQMNYATEQGQKRIKNTLSKTADRYKAVDVNKLPLNLQKELTNKIIAVESLVQIAEYSLNKPKITKKQINLLTSSAAEIKVEGEFN